MDFREGDIVHFKGRPWRFYEAFPPFEHRSMLARVNEQGQLIGDPHGMLIRHYLRPGEIEQLEPAKPKSVAPPAPIPPPVPGAPSYASPLEAFQSSMVSGESLCRQSASRGTEKWLQCLATNGTTPAVFALLLFTAKKLKWGAHLSNDHQTLSSLLYRHFVPLLTAQLSTPEIDATIRKEAFVIYDEAPSLEAKAVAKIREYHYVDYALEEILGVAQREIESSSTLESVEAMVMALVDRLPLNPQRARATVVNERLLPFVEELRSLLWRIVPVGKYGRKPIAEDFDGFLYWINRSGPPMPTMVRMLGVAARRAVTDNKAIDLWAAMLAVLSAVARRTIELTLKDKAEPWHNHHYYTSVKALLGPLVVVRRALLGEDPAYVQRINQIAELEWAQGFLFKAELQEGQELGALEAYYDQLPEKATALKLSVHHLALATRDLQSALGPDLSKADPMLAAEVLAFEGGYFWFLDAYLSYIREIGYPDTNWRPLIVEKFGSMLARDGGGWQ